MAEHWAELVLLFPVHAHDQGPVPETDVETLFPVAQRFVVGALESELLLLEPQAEATTV